VAGGHLSLERPGGAWRSSFCTALVAACLLAPATSAADDPAPCDHPEPLPGLGVDGAAVTVSGVSSGGFLAHQLHVALSRTVAGAGIYAAGPYACAGTEFPLTLFRALTVCADMTGPFPFLGPPDANRSMGAVRTAADAETIDATSGLAGDRVLLFAGRRDRLVPPSVVRTVADLYRAFGVSEGLTIDDHVDAPHAMITESFGNACDVLAPPFINACGFDLAGATLQHVAGPLAPATEPKGRLLAFDQQAFVGEGRAHGLAEAGYVFVPKACAQSPGCRLHIALHGCGQTATQIGDAFYRHAGYNPWAEANRIVVLYPQAAVLTTAFLGVHLPWPNPQGCWDWWGFTGKDFATRSGAQIAAIAQMIERLATSPGVSGSSAPVSSCARAGGG
jgi:poly(3-hydroxybutyrate) depolymerase